MAIQVYIYWALFITSTAYSYEMSRKARSMAKSAAEAAKGYNFPVEGEASPVFVIYGRNLVGGIRVFHGVKSNFIHAAVNSLTASTFTTSSAAFTQSEPRVGAPDGEGSYATIENELVNYPAVQSLVSNKSGTKNEFLFVQQVIGFGAINGVYAIDVDGKDFSHPDYSFGLRADIEHNGGVASPLMSANFGGDRNTALFTHTAYASVVYRLNRDDPQFGGSVPTTQFYVRGMSVAPINFVSGSYIIGAKRYSNNPAECLLDYLLNPIYGRGLPAASIDLKSFYDAAIVCDRVVQVAASSGGKIWAALNNGAVTSSFTRNLPLYECNILINSSKSIRENVEEILATMADADLVWSGGVYRLLLQYPTSTAEIMVAGPTITDSDIVRDSISITYPSASERKNFCNIQFRNEMQDFKNDTAGWPPRFSPLHTLFLNEDNQVPLEMNLTMTGIVDIHHATAKAEEMVRASRSNVFYDFKMFLNGIAYEPGDIIFVNSIVAGITNEYLKIKEVKFGEDNIASIKAVKFDYRTLAWNAKDNEAVAPRNNYNFVVSPPTNVAYAPDGALYGYTSGKITWVAPADGTAIVEYIVYGASSLNSTGPGLNTLVYNELGRSRGLELQITGLESAWYVFGVIAVTANGRRSKQILSNPVEIIKPPIPAGADGANGTEGISSYTVEIYRQSNTTPPFPIAGSYIFTGDVFVPPKILNGIQQLDPHWGNVVLLLKMNGVNGATNFVDSSLYNRPVSNGGNPQMSTVQSKFGGSSALFNASSSISVPHSTDFVFGNNNFTLEAWIYLNAPVVGGTYPGVISRRIAANSSNAWVLYVNGDAGSLPGIDWSATGSSITGSAFGPAVTPGQWHHIAAVRNNGFITVYTNGIAGTPSNIGTQLLFPSSISTAVGVLNQGAGNFFNGYIDDVRITKDTARYTSNFTPPSNEFPDILSVQPVTGPRAVLYIRADNIAEDRPTRVFSSLPYPTVTTESINVTHDFLGGKFLSAFTEESVDVTHAFNGGTLTQPLTTYNNAIAESVDVTHAFTDGVLTNVLLTYSNSLPESVDVTHAFTGGVLTTILLTYSNSLPESVDVTHAFISGTLT